MKNYSRQREAILSVLSNTKTHPTADWIYKETRKIIPNISLGTVYRNLSALSKSGIILSIDVGDGKEHFDFDTSPHLHLTCKECGCIIDGKIGDNNPIASIGEDYGFNVETPVFVVYGYCKNCKPTS